MRRVFAGVSAMFAGVSVMLVFGAGIVVGGAVGFDFAEAFRGEEPKIAHCRAVLRNDERLWAMTRFSGITSRVGAHDAESLICGCATDSSAPTETGRWGYRRDLRTQRIPWCIGIWQGKLDDVGADAIVRVQRR